MKLQDILSEDWRADAEARRIDAAARMQAAGTHTSPRNISQERWDDLVRKFGITAAREEDLSVERDNRRRDSHQQHVRDSAYERGINKLNQSPIGRQVNGEYDERQAAIAKQERDSGASVVDGHGKPRAFGGQVDTTQSPNAQRQAQQHAQQQFAAQAAAQRQQFQQQVAAANAKKNAQIAAADRGEYTAPPNPSQATNTRWARQNGFKSIRDFYNDIMKRTMSSDPKVAQLAAQQEKQYYANVKADRARMAQK